MQALTTSKGGCQAARLAPSDSLIHKWATTLSPAAEQTIAALHRWLHKNASKPMPAPLAIHRQHCNNHQSARAVNTAADKPQPAASTVTLSLVPTPLYVQLLPAPSAQPVPSLPPPRAQQSTHRSTAIAAPAFPTSASNSVSDNDDLDGFIVPDSFVEKAPRYRKRLVRTDNTRIQIPRRSR